MAAYERVVALLAGVVLSGTSFERPRERITARPRSRSLAHLPGAHCSQSSSGSNSPPSPESSPYPKGSASVDTFAAGASATTPPRSEAARARNRARMARDEALEMPWPEFGADADSSNLDKVGATRADEVVWVDVARVRN
jgi:hypothetical protein